MRVILLYVKLVKVEKFQLYLFVYLKFNRMYIKGLIKDWFGPSVNLI